jgi:hypothetical protein
VRDSHLRRVPRRVDGHLLGHGVESQDPLQRAEQRHRVDARRGVGLVADDLPAGGDDAVARPVRRVRLDAHLLGQRQQHVLVRADERAADVEGRATGALLRPHAATDAVARLEHDDLLACL